MKIINYKNKNGSKLLEQFLNKRRLGKKKRYYNCRKNYQRYKKK